MPISWFGFRVKHGMTMLCGAVSLTSSSVVPKNDDNQKPLPNPSFRKMHSIYPESGEARKADTLVNQAPAAKKAQKSISDSRTIITASGIHEAIKM